MNSVFPWISPNIRCFLFWRRGAFLQQCIFPVTLVQPQHQESSCIYKGVSASVLQLSQMGLFQFYYWPGPNTLGVKRRGWPDHCRCLRLFISVIHEYCKWPITMYLWRSLSQMGGFILTKRMTSCDLNGWERKTYCIWDNSKVPVLFQGLEFLFIFSL